MPFEPIAIVGRSCLLPGASTPEALWAAVRDGRDLLSRAPAGRWGIGVERIIGVGGNGRGDTGDRAVSDRGGYVSVTELDSESEIDPNGFAIPATEIAALDPVFQWTFHTARRALRDSGTTDSARVGAIFGNLSFPSAGMSRFAEATWLTQSNGPVTSALRDAGL